MENTPGVAILFLLLDPPPELNTEKERGRCVQYIYVEYAEGRMKYSIPFTFLPFFMNTVTLHMNMFLSFRVHQAEYVIHILVAASQE